MADETTPEEEDPQLVRAVQLLKSWHIFKQFDADNNHAVNQ